MNKQLVIARLKRGDRLTRKPFGYCFPVNQVVNYDYIMDLKLNLVGYNDKGQPVYELGQEA